SPTFHGDDWVRVEVMVLGDSIMKHIVNGDTVMSYTQPQIGGGSVSGHDPAVKEDGKLLSMGFIALQAETAPIDFRRVEVLELVGCTDPAARNYKSYYLMSDNESCIYAN
ncbi:MAG TPA: family 16 glycoside hydrolase, partial [Longimicrobiales bacterium]|nr:family 16 glycoside hydrolase [Longimicrobiales bacterium]